MQDIFVGSYVEQTLSKIKGYNPDWISLITSNPLIFEDVDYFKIKNYVNNNITEKELKAYKDAKLRKLYANLELMLMDNILYYDRIISFITMYFLGYIRIWDLDNNSYVSQKDIPEHEVDLTMTPTKLWCISMTSPESTLWELEYAHDLILKESEESNDNLRNNFAKIQKHNKLFNVFSSYRSYITNVEGYVNTLTNDVISDNRLNSICGKFSDKFAELGIEKLKGENGLIDYINEIEKNSENLYKSLNKCLEIIYPINEKNNEKHYSVFIFNSNIQIHTSKFSMKIYKTENNKLSKHYESNSFECFQAEKYLLDSMKDQINWVQYNQPIMFNKIKKNLSNILEKLLKEDHTEVICIKKMGGLNSDNVSMVTFTGMFDNMYFVNELRSNNKIIRKYKKCLSIKTLSEYLIDEGYYIFGYYQDVLELMNQVENNKELFEEKIINFYIKYSSDVKNYITPIIDIYKKYNQDIIKFILSDEVDKMALGTNIRVTSFKGIKNYDALNISKNINRKIKFQEEDNKKSYFNIINS